MQGTATSWTTQGCVGTRGAWGHAGHGDMRERVGQGDAGAAGTHRVSSGSDSGSRVLGFCSIHRNSIKERSAPTEWALPPVPRAGGPRRGATTRAPWRPPQCSAPRSIPGRTLPRQTAAQPGPPMTWGGEGARAAALGDPRPGKPRHGAGLGEGTQRGAECARLRGASVRGTCENAWSELGWARALGSVQGRVGACMGV